MEISSRNKFAIIASLLWAILTFLFIVFGFSIGKNPYGPFTLVHCGALAFFMILCGLYIRAFKPHWSFNFLEGLKFGSILGVSSTFIVLIFGFIYLKITWDDNFPIYVENMTDFYTSLKDNGELEKIGEVDKTAAANNIELLKKASAWNIVFADFSLKMITSILISFIIAVTMRK